MASDPLFRCLACGSALTSPRETIVKIKNPPLQSGEFSLRVSLVSRERT